MARRLPWVERDVLSNHTECNKKGGAQQSVPAGAGTARFPRPAEEVGAGADGGAAAASEARPRLELRWVGAQHLMHGYCGRATECQAADVNGAATRAAAAGGARAYAVRPVALLEARRHLVVRIGPRAVGASEDAPVSPAGVEENGTSRARAA